MRRRWIPVFAVFFAAAAAQAALLRSYALPWPHFDELVGGPWLLQDVALAASGFRRLGADIAWVQLLQFAGSEQAFDDTHLIIKKYGKGHHAHDGHHHPAEPAPDNVKTELFDRALRVARLDPYFTDAYLFGAGILAWSPAFDRPDEALRLLREGARYNPEFWPIQTYIVGILYKKQARVGEMRSVLEQAIHKRDCPTVVKSVLANYYKSQMMYREAIRVWTIILNNPNDRWYHDHAARQIEQLLSLLQPA